MTYFAGFGYPGLIGLFAACALIAFCGARALLTVMRGNIQDPHALNIAVGGKAIGSFITIWFVCIFRIYHYAGGD